MSMSMVRYYKTNPKLNKFLYEQINSKNTSVKTICAVGNYYKKIGIWKNLVKR